MAKRPTYEELEQRVKELEKEVVDRNRMEEALRESEERYRTLVEESFDGIFIQKGPKIIFANKRLHEMLGYEDGDLIGLDHWLVYHPEYQELTRERAQARMRGEKVIAQYEVKLQRKDGSWFYGEISARPITFDSEGGRGIQVWIKDIMGRKLAEEALRENEEKYRTILDSIEETYFEVDIAGNFTFFNDSLSKILGYSNHELLGMNNRDYMSPESSKKIYDVFSQIYRTGNPIKKVVYEIIRKDGGHGFHELSASLMKDQTGQPIGFRGIAHDITDLKKARDALRESEEKYRSILESIEEGYYEVDIAGNFTFFNDSLCKILGYPDDEIIGMNYKKYTDEETAQKVYHVFNRVYTTGKPATGFNWPVTRKDGGIGYVEISVSPTTDSEGQAIGFMGIVRDVTERKQMEEELINTKNFLQNILDSSIDGISTTDLKGEVLYCNPRLKDMIGYDLKQVIGKKVSTFYWNGIEDAKKIMKELMAKGEIRNREVQFKKKGGGFVDAILSASLLRDEGGEVTGTLGIFKDIGDKKKLEAQVQQSQKMEAIATLAGGIAHQFNNALTSITGHTGLLEMNYHEDEKIKKYAGAMKHSALRMAYLTSQLLAYARGGKYDPQIISLTDFVESTLPLIQHTIDPAISVETDLPMDILNVKADHTQMQMVLSAIVANASEAIEGPGRIRISVRNMDLDREFIKDHPGLKPGPYVCLSIEDDGKGMDQETRSKIFDPFYTTHFIGRGLGMAAVYGIVTNHDGSISVDSELGKGTVVRIYLPTIEAEEEVKKKVVSKPEIELPTGEGTILVIEDEEDVMMLIRQVLERLGYRVLEAETGKKAVKIAKTFDGQIDLALLDIKLPDISGGKVYPLIMEARPDLKVIVCSGYSIDGPAQDILDAGAEGFVQKPFSISTLAEKLKEVLEGK